MELCTWSSSVDSVFVSILPRSCILPIGLLFAGVLWTGNAAYLFLSVSFIQMLKVLRPALQTCIASRADAACTHTHTHTHTHRLH